MVPSRFCDGRVCSQHGLASPRATVSSPRKQLGHVGSRSSHVPSSTGSVLSSLTSGSDSLVKGLPASWTAPLLSGAAGAPVPTVLPALSSVASSIASTHSSSGSNDATALLKAVQSIRTGQQDPVAAAHQLQQYLLQYKSQYGGSGGTGIDARIDAASRQLQLYLDGSEAQQAGIPLPGPYGSVRSIVDSMASTLDWVTVVLRNPPVTVADAAGRSGAAAGPGASAAHEAAHLMEASTTLRGMVKDLSQASSNGAVRPEEQRALDSVGHQVQGLADKLAVAATRRAEAGGAATGGAGTAGSHDPVSSLLDGVHDALVQDSGLRSLFKGIQDLGGNIVAAMDATWLGAPPAARLVAYIAAVAGAIFVIRTRVPRMLQTATSSEAVVATDGSTAMVALPLTSLQQLDRDRGVAADTRLPSELLAANDPRGARQTVVDVEASVSPSAASPPALASPAVSTSSNTTGLSPHDGNGNSASSSFGGVTRDSTLGHLGSASPTFAASTSGTHGSSIGEANGARLYGGVNGSGRSSSSSSNGNGGSGRVLEPAFAMADSYNGGGGGGRAGSLAASPASAAPTAPETQPWSRGLNGALRDRTASVVSSSPAAVVSSTVAKVVAPSSPGASTVMSSSSFPAASRLSSPSPPAASRVMPSAAAASVLAAADLDERAASDVVRVDTVRRREKERLVACDQIKERLRWVTRVMGPFSAVVPAGEPVREEVDKLVGQLEALTPTDKPLNTQADLRAAAASPSTFVAPPPRPDPRLMGAWRLVYASSGTSSEGDGNLLAQFLHLLDGLPGFGMSHVVQSLRPDAVQQGAVVMENSAVFRFGPLGSWRIGAAGRWRDNGGGMCAQSWFDTLLVKPVDALGGLVNSLPEIVVPIPEPVRMHSEWCTTYLDGDTRIGRGGGSSASGNLFLFEKA